MTQFNSRNSEGALTEVNLSEADFEDVVILCLDCSEDFIWTTGEQLFFHDKKLTNPPKRCKACKKAKNDRIESVLAAQAAGVKQKIEVAVHCATCENFTTVPFYPSQGRPVYCRSCYLKMNPGILRNNGNNNSSNNHI